MPSKKKSLEALPAEAETKQTRRAVVAAKHTVTYEAPEVVDIPIDPEDEEETEEGQFIEIESAQRQPSFRTKIRDKFKARGIGVDESLMLRIDRLPFFKQNGLSGVMSEKEFCGVIPCTEKFFDNDDYLIEIQRRYGPGDYQLTVRHKNAIVSSWREHVSGFPGPVTVQSNEPGQPPTVIYQQPGQQATPAKTIKDEMREVAEIMKMVDAIRGPRPEENGHTAPAPIDPEVALLQGLAGNDKFMEKINNGFIRKFLGNSAGDDEPGWTTVAMELVKSGQASQLAETIIKTIFNGFSGMIPRGQNNGQTPMAQTPHAPMGEIPAAPHQMAQTSQLGMAQNIQAQPASAESPPQAGAHADAGQPQQVTPADQALSMVMSDCARKIPPKVTAGNLISFADAVNDQAPAYSIDGWITFFATTPTDEVFEVVKTLPRGDEIASLPHAREWTEQLQKLLLENQEGESSE